MLFREPDEAYNNPTKNARLPTDSDEDRQSASTLIANRVLREVLSVVFS
jgi:hypothetical protein